MKIHTAGFMFAILFSMLGFMYAYGEQSPRVAVIPADQFLSAPDESPPVVECAYISKSYFHIAENLHTDRSMPNYAGRYSFAAFRIIKGKLYRDLFFVTNPEGIAESGFYMIDYKVLKSSVRSGLRTNEILISRAVKASRKIEEVNSVLRSLVKKHSSAVVLKNLKQLNSRYSNLAPIENIESCLFPGTGGRRGVDAAEYLGFVGGRYLYRVFLSNADNARYKKENSVARGYFLYVSFDFDGTECDYMYTVVDYSIYIK